MLYIVGLGPGNKDYILPKAIETLKKSDVVIGFKRLINDLNFIDTNKIVINSLRETLDYIQQNGQENIISLVASGESDLFCYK